jgi:hypothetical protein
LCELDAFALGSVQIKNGRKNLALVANLRLRRYIDGLKRLASIERVVVDQPEARPRPNSHLLQPQAIQERAPPDYLDARWNHDETEELASRKSESSDHPKPRWLGSGESLHPTVLEAASAELLNRGIKRNV